MSWIKLDDNWDQHPKVLRVSAQAVLLWLRSLTYSGRMLTDGFVPQGAIRMLTNEADPESLAAELVRAVPQGYASGLFEVCDGGWQIHDFLDHNPSRAEVTTKRRADAERKRGTRNPERVQTESARNPDGVRKESACPDPSRSRPDPPPTGPDRTPPDTEGECEGGKPAKKSRRKPETPMPEGWEPDDKHYKVGADEGFTRAQVDRFAVGFRGYVAKNDVRYRDWGAAFSAWLRHDYRKTEQASPSAPRRGDRGLQTGPFVDTSVDIDTLMPGDSN